MARRHSRLDALFGHQMTSRPRFRRPWVRDQRCLCGSESYGADPGVPRRSLTSDNDCIRIVVYFSSSRISRNPPRIDHPPAVGGCGTTGIRGRFRFPLRRPAWLRILPGAVASLKAGPHPWPQLSAALCPDC